jgi:hypothetical protein
MLAKGYPLLHDDIVTHTSSFRITETLLLPYGIGEIGGVVLDTPLCTEQAATFLVANGVGSIRAFRRVGALSLADPVARIGRNIDVTGLATARAF